MYMPLSILLDMQWRESLACRLQDMQRVVSETQFRGRECELDNHQHQTVSYLQQKH